MLETGIFCASETLAELPGKGIVRITNYRPWTPSVPVATRKGGLSDEKSVVCSTRVCGPGARLDRPGRVGRSQDHEHGLRSGDRFDSERRFGQLDELGQRTARGE